MRTNTLLPLAFCLHHKHARLNSMDVTCATLSWPFQLLTEDCPCGRNNISQREPEIMIIVINLFPQVARLFIIVLITSTFRVTKPQSSSFTS